MRYLTETSAAGIGLAVLALGALIFPRSAMAECTLESGNHQIFLAHGGGQRSFRVYVPAGCDPAAPFALVVDFHGLGGTSIFQIPAFRRIADAERLVVAAPDAIEGKWNIPGDRTAGKSDDTGFTRALVADLSERLPIDPSRIYASGFSSGAGFAHRLGCEAADLIAAIAPVASPLPNASCTPSRAIPVMDLIGLRDPGYEALPLFDTPSAPDGFARWAGINGCVGEPARTSIGPVGFEDRFLSCDEGVEVVLVSLDATHGDAYFAAGEIDVVQTAWDFMSRFTLVPEPRSAAGLIGVLLGLAALVRRGRPSQRKSRFTP